MSKNQLSLSAVSAIRDGLTQDEQHMFDRRIYELLRYECDVAKRTLVHDVNEYIGYPVINVDSHINDIHDIARITTELTAAAYRQGLESPFVADDAVALSHQLRILLERNAKRKYDIKPNITKAFVMDTLAEAKESKAHMMVKDTALVLQSCVNDMLRLPGSHAVDLYDAFVDNSRAQTASDSFFRSEFKTAFAAHCFAKLAKLELPETEPAHMDEPVSELDNISHTLLKLFIG